MLFRKISFFKIPSHQRFNFDPRYYDPIKEELQERQEIIKKELELTKKNEASYNGDRIKGSFRNTMNFESSNHYESKTNRNAGTIRAVLIVILTGGIWGYWEFGSDVGYFFLFLIPIYFILRRRKIL